MKIAVIGGGSTYTPELIEGFARRADVLQVDELVLHDIDADRLGVVGWAGPQDPVPSKGFRARSDATTSLDDAVEGAAAVLLQLRVGGQLARLGDETIPGRFGLIGQETTGPGGFAKALRTVPVVLGIAEGRRQACGARRVDRRLHQPGRHHHPGAARRGPPCNRAVQRRDRVPAPARARFGVRPDQVRLEHVGLNHLSWIRGVRVPGARLPELLARDCTRRAGRGHRDPGRADAHDPRDPLLLPPLLLLHRQAVEAQRNGPQRAEEVLEIERTLLEMYADPALDHKPALLESAAARTTARPRQRS